MKHEQYERWFNASRKSNSSELSNLIGEACSLIPRKRDLRAEQHRKVEAVIADLLDAHLTGIERVLIDRNPRRYERKSPYQHPIVETGTLCALLKEMRRVGIVDWTAGSSGKGVSRMFPGE